MKPEPSRTVKTVSVRSFSGAMSSWPFCRQSSMTTMPSPMLRGRGTGPRSEYRAASSGLSNGTLSRSLVDAQFQQRADELLLLCFVLAPDAEGLAELHRVRHGQARHGVGQRLEAAADEELQGVLVCVQDAGHAHVEEPLPAPFELGGHHSVAGGVRCLLTYLRASLCHAVKRVRREGVGTMTQVIAAARAAARCCETRCPRPSWITAALSRPTR